MKLKFLAMAVLLNAQQVFAADLGHVAWNGICRAGVFGVVGSNCSSEAPCSLIMSSNGSHTTIAQWTDASSVQFADVPAGMSSWTVEVGGVAVTDALVIDAATRCPNQGQ